MSTPHNIIQFGSVVLGGFYLIFLYFGKEWINWLLGIYFSLAGALSVWRSATTLTRRMMGDTKWKSYDRLKLLAVLGTREVGSFALRTPSILLIIPSILPSVAFAASPSPKPAWATNVLALSLAQNALSLLKLDSFGTGCILLSGLFVYDVWWVFGTKVMVTVAKGLDVPIKLLWPKSLDLSSAQGYAMLGLGDIVVPGTFVALALRYDLYRSGHDASTPYKKPYFTATLISYVIGLLTTMIVMHNFKAAQPALLYLSPSCILSFLITATFRGELKDALKWVDEAAPVAPANLSLDDLPVLEPETPLTEELTPKLKDAPEYLAASKTGEDFINVEKDEWTEDASTEGNQRRRRSRKKKA